MARPDGCGVALGCLPITDLRLLAIDPHEVRLERVPVGSDENGLQRPVLAGRKGTNLPFAVDDDPYGDRLNPPRRKTGANLAPEKRAKRIADEPVDDSPGLLRVDQVLVDFARLGERLLDCRFGDLREGDAPGATRYEFRSFRNVQAIASPSRSRSVAR